MFSDPVVTLDCLTQHVECQIRRYDCDDELRLLDVGVGGRFLTQESSS